MLCLNVMQKEKHSWNHFEKIWGLFCDSFISVVFLGIDAVRKAYSCISLFKNKYTVLSRNRSIRKGDYSV